MAVNNRIHEFQKQRDPIVFIQHNDEALVTGTKKWQITPLIDYCTDTDIIVQKRTKGTGGGENSPFC